MESVTENHRNICFRCSDNIPNDIPDHAAFFCEQCWFNWKSFTFNCGQIYTYDGTPVTDTDFTRMVSRLDDHNF